MKIISKLLKCNKFAWRSVQNGFSTQTAVTTKELLHTPVMVNEVLESLKPKDGQVFIDMTFGAGGHTREILKVAPHIKLFVLDRDPVSYNLAKEFAAEYPNQVIPLLGRFSELPSLLSSHNVRQNSVDGVLFDLGCSSMQFDVASRGFSLSQEGPLDMRMDGCRFPDEPTVADVLAYCDEHSLAKVLKFYGEEKQAKKIARAIIEARYTFKRLETTKELADLVMAVCSNDIRVDKLSRPAHTATKTFQALRILVNNEVNEINYALIIAHAYLKFSGKVVTLSFHSLEDRIVKRHLCGNVIDNAVNPLPLKYTSHSFCYGKEEVQALCKSNWKLLYKHVLTPKYDEVENNPRSRSAKLRAAIKIS